MTWKRSIFLAVVSIVISSAVIASPIVNINIASAEELSAQLSGVGKQKAQAIVAYRAEHGNFTSIDDLEKVPGIGATVIAHNRDRVYANP